MKKYLLAFLFGSAITLCMAAYQPGLFPGTVGTPSADVVTFQAPTSNLIKYAAPTGGLVSTTAVSAIAAAGASTFNYITNVTCVNSNAATNTEVEIQDGNGGTVMFRGWAQAAGGGFSANFDRVPLKGTANTATYIKEVTATATNGVICSLQGFTGT